MPKGCQIIIYGNYKRELPISVDIDTASKQIKLSGMIKLYADEIEYEDMDSCEFLAFYMYKMANFDPYEAYKRLHYGN